jgi:hypothetical protein
MSTEHFRDKRGSTRWYRYTDTGIERKVVFAGEPLPDHTWTQGIAPTITDERRQSSSARFRGVPKTDTQKSKMRAAKLGVAKTAQHKSNMRASQLAHSAEVKAIMEETPLTYREAQLELKRRKALLK